jgi:hypothetical protein
MCPLWVSVATRIALLSAWTVGLLVLRISFKKNRSDLWHVGMVRELVITPFRSAGVRSSALAAPALLSISAAELLASCGCPLSK